MKLNNLSDRQYEAHIWLSRMWDKGNKLSSYEKRRTDIISQLSGVGKYDADFIPSGNSESNIEIKNIEYSIICEKIEHLLTEISEENVKTTQIIDKVKDPTLNNMLYDRYINRMSWSKIGGKYHYAQRQPYRYMHKCLSIVRNYIPDEWVRQAIIDSGIEMG